MSQANKDLHDWLSQWKEKAPLLYNREFEFTRNEYTTEIFEIKLVYKFSGFEKIYSITYNFQITSFGLSFSKSEVDEMLKTFDNLYDEHLVKGIKDRWNNSHTKSFGKKHWIAYEKGKQANEQSKALIITEGVDMGMGLYPLDDSLKDILTKEYRIIAWKECKGR